MSTPASDQTALASRRSRLLRRRGKIDVYTMMLIIAFICMLTASVLMFVEWGRWEFTTGPAPGAALQTVPDAVSTAVVFFEQPPCEHLA